ncbi:MAG: hypothetical protein MZW92_60750 [Comamonadaceae bacterium]|nr:hypothetical protein [Comamonadaceae bacterium]
MGLRSAVQQRPCRRRLPRRLPAAPAETPIRMKPFPSVLSRHAARDRLHAARAQRTGCPELRRAPSHARGRRGRGVGCRLCAPRRSMPARLSATRSKSSRLVARPSRRARPR